MEEKIIRKVEEKEGKLLELLIDEKEPIIQVLASAAEKVTGKKPLLHRGTAACDMRHLVNQGRIPTTVFGPGSGDQIHKPDEFIPVDSIVSAVQTLVQTLALAIYHWCR